MDYLRYHSTHFKISELSDEVIRYFTIESYTGFCECYGYYEYYNHVEIPKLFYENNNFIIFTELDGIEQFNLINEFKSSFENYYDEICNYFIYNYFLIEINSSESVPNLDIPNQKKEFDSKLKAHEWGVLGRLVIDQFYNKRKPTQWEMALAIHCITGYSKDKLKNTYITGQNKIDDLSDESKINLSTIIQSLIDELE